MSNIWIPLIYADSLAQVNTATDPVCSWDVVHRPLGWARLATSCIRGHEAKLCPINKQFSSTIQGPWVSVANSHSGCMLVLKKTWWVSHETIVQFLMCTFIFISVSTHLAFSVWTEHCSLEEPFRHAGKRTIPVRKGFPRGNSHSLAYKNCIALEASWNRKLHSIRLLVGTCLRGASLQPSSNIFIIWLRTLSGPLPTIWLDQWKKEVMTNGHWSPLFTQSFPFSWDLGCWENLENLV